MKSINNFVGAFADGAVLFPLVMTLSLQNGMSLSYLLLSSGIAYLVAGYVFRIPMSVQPLKSIAIAGLSIGASAYEIRIAALLLGLTFIASLLFDLESYAEKVPERIIHGVQVGLGCILVQQGFKYVVPSGLEFVFLAVLLVAGMLFITYKFQYPILGIVASVGFFSSMFWLKKINLTPGDVSIELTNIRPVLILSLILPQIVLTSANSVLATVNVSHKYFGENAEKVTVRRLVCMIGLGNVMSGIFGGLPFCHGSGGVTAHYNGGAKTSTANYFIGASLLVAAIAAFIFGRAQMIFAPLLLSVLLITVGCMHVALARPSWSQGSVLKLQLAFMALAALAFGNMLWVLGVGLVFEGLNKSTLLLLGKKAL